MTVTLPLGIPEDLLRPPPPPPAKRSRSKKNAVASSSSSSAASTAARQLVLPFNNSTKVAVTPLTAPLDASCQRGVNDWLSFGRVPADVPHGLALAAEAVRRAKRVVVISGAGISTHAIPDFRSSSGLFKEIAAQAKAEAKGGKKGVTAKRLRGKGGEAEVVEGKSGRSTPSADMSGIKSGKDLFDVKCFTSPDMLAHHHNLLNRLTELSHSAEPSAFHRLLKSLDDDGRLMRCYTQNIDGLEGKAGLDCRVPEAKDWAKAPSGGNKRRKLNQSQQSPSSSPKEASMDAFPPSSSQSSSVSGVSDLLDPSPCPTPPTPTRNSVAPTLPTCIPLHGLLETLDCTRCDYREPMSRDRPLPDEMLPCPKCLDDHALRVATSARPRSVGFLRASVILYGEEHKHGEAIGAVVERDLVGRTKDSRVDLLIVAGTTLQIPGVKRIIKEFARVLQSKPSSSSSKRGAMAGSGTSSEHDDEDSNADDDDEDVDVASMPIRTMLLNRDPPSRGKAGEWAGVFDVWVQGDLQQFVEQWVTQGPEPTEMRPSSSGKSASVSPRKRKSPPAAPIVAAPISPAAKRTKVTVKLAGATKALSIGQRVAAPTVRGRKAVIALAPTQPLISKAFVASKSGKELDDKLVKLPSTPRKRGRGEASRKENEHVEECPPPAPMPIGTPKRAIKKSAKAQYTPKRNSSDTSRPLAKSAQPSADADDASAAMASWSTLPAQEGAISELDRLSVSSALQGDAPSIKDMSDDERDCLAAFSRRAKPRADSTTSSDLSEVPEEDENESDVLASPSKRGRPLPKVSLTLRRSARISVA